MGFKFSQSATFTAPVTVMVPNDKGGFDKNQFVAHFKRHTLAELDELRAKNLSNEECLRRVLVGWDMRDEDTGEVVEFNPITLEAALQVVPTPLHTATVFWESVNGARSKNL